MRKIAILAAMVMMILAVFAMIGVATGSAVNDKTAVAIGYGYPNNVAPHGNYTAGSAPLSVAPTDYCLQCHMVHGAQGDYALMRENTVTDVCATCHQVYGATPDGTWTKARLVDWNTDTSNTTPPLPTSKPTTSMFGAFKNLTPRSSHGVGLGNNGIAGEPTNTLKVISSTDLRGAEGTLYDNEPVTTFTATNGLYCASCHTPHGSNKGHDTDNDPSTRELTNGTDVTVTGPECAQSATTGKLSYKGPVKETDSSGNIIGYHAYGATTTSTGGTLTPPADAVGCPDVTDGSYGRQLVVDAAATDTHPKLVFPDRLLSREPNHEQYKDIKAGGVMRDAKGYNEFCMTCHTTKDDLGAVVYSGVPMTPSPDPTHNHPPICVSCHGNPKSGSSGYTTADSNNDFPHTSMNEKLLPYNSDRLCLGCHTPADGISNGTGTTPSTLP